MAIEVFFLLCFTGVASGSSGLINATEWFKRYEEVIVTFVDGNEGISRMSFDDKEESFTFMLLPVMTSQSEFSPENIQLTVDNTSIPLINFMADIKLFRGNVRKNGHLFSALVKITAEGLDAMISSPIDSIVLEPAKRFFARTESEKLETSDQFHCILYRGSDLKKVLFSDGVTNKTFKSDQIKSRSSLQIKERLKRQSWHPSMTVCMLHISADQSFYSFYSSNIATVVSEMMYFVMEADKVFKDTDFNGDGSPDNIRIQVHRITVHTQRTNYQNYNDNSEAYLDYFSMSENFSASCLGTSFTSIAFPYAAGLANMGYSDPSFAGGICERYRVFYYMNTNYVSTHSNVGPRPKIGTALILAHEIGHSFGSDHDSDTVCPGTASAGPYVMWPFATYGTKPNNYFFSSCSISQMYPTIVNKGKCFLVPPVTACGNGVKEDGEECDCGSNSTCLTLDPCCTPSDAKSPQIPCKYRSSAVCSRTADVCCTSSCTFTPASEQKVCKAATDCTLASVCDGSSSACPAAANVVDETPCGVNKTCKSGMCIGHICDWLHLDSCECSGQDDCYTCCSYWINEAYQCHPFVSSAGDYDYLEPGTVCGELDGYCDGRGKCKRSTTEVDGTIDRLKQNFIAAMTEGLGNWFQKYWYYLLVAIATLLLAVAVFVFTFRGQHASTTARLHGRFARIQHEIETQKSYLETRKAIVKSKYEKKIAQIGKRQVLMQMTDAVGRLMIFFPLTSRDMILQALTMSIDEESAVLLLLSKNQPFRRFTKETESDLTFFMDTGLQDTDYNSLYAAKSGKTDGDLHGKTDSGRNSTVTGTIDSSVMAAE